MKLVETMTDMEFKVFLLRATPYVDRWLFPHPVRLWLTVPR